ncbi:hypothetical protein [Weissella confusa]|uniref:Uncharacterized protein n=1 Tax=Weissella confusa TaxID=1583 RepID=A0AAJ3DBE9_WEICO|nr:hypothetical protein [Weissella confusa]NBA10937.1 hypothetical protein [Weissella confusa]
MKQKIQLKEASRWFSMGLLLGMVGVGLTIGGLEIKERRAEAQRVTVTHDEKKDLPIKIGSAQPLKLADTPVKVDPNVQHLTMKQRIALMMLSAGVTVGDDTKLYASPQGNGETWLLDGDGNKLITLKFIDGTKRSVTFMDGRTVDVDLNQAYTSLHAAQAYRDLTDNIIVE